MEKYSLQFENELGEKYEVKVINKFDYNNKTFAVCENVDDEDLMYIFEIKHTEEGDTLVSIDDENELRELEMEYNKVLNENIQ